ncbi:MAG: hypothetical protein MUC92_06320 [Fimbriimonadaceae bacterium]|nr:hypothetical protein [Fimbriimonadaceae bacterium]
MVQLQLLVAAAIVAVGVFGFFSDFLRDSQRVELTKISFIILLVGWLPMALRMRSGRSTLFLCLAILPSLLVPLGRSTMVSLAISLCSMAAILVLGGLAAHHMVRMEDQGCGMDLDQS